MTVVQKLYMTPTGVQILGVSPTGVQKLGMPGVKNLGVSDRCAKTVHDADRYTKIGCVTDRCSKIGHDRCEKSGCE